MVASDGHMNENTPSSIRLWHGSQRWEGKPHIRPSRPGCYECGPGLYLTTSLNTAGKYSKGAGKAVLMELDPDLRLLEDAFLTEDEMLGAIRSLPRVRNRAAVLADIRWASERMDGKPLPASTLVNVCVNNNALPGESGPALAAWLTEKGIDASLGKDSANEQWIVLFNPAKIRNAAPMKAADAWEVGHCDLIQAQGHVRPLSGAAEAKRSKRTP